MAIYAAFLKSSEDAQDWRAILDRQGPHGKVRQFSSPEAAEAYLKNRGVPKEKREVHEIDHD